MGAEDDPSSGARGPAGALATDTGSAFSIPRQGRKGLRDSSPPRAEVLAQKVSEETGFRVVAPACSGVGSPSSRFKEVS